MTTVGDSVSVSYFDFLNVWRQNGCPVCQLSTRSVKQLLNDLFSENAEEPDVIFQMLKSRGLCAEHSRLLLEEMDTDELRATIIYEHIVKSILRGFSAAIPSLLRASTPANSRLRTQALAKLKKTFKREEQCPACVQRDVAVNHLLDELSGQLQNERIRAALAKSDGLCLPHLAGLLERIQSAENTEFLLNLTRQKLEMTRINMQGLILKRDRLAQFEEPNKNEIHAWKKAMSMISGDSVRPTDKERNY